jgi:hypothetical protein
MTNPNHRKNDPPIHSRLARQHGESRKKRHRKRPCGGNEPATPSGLSFDWDVVEKHRHRRLSVSLEWNPVRTNTAGAQSFMRRYRVQLQRSLDGGTTTAGKTRKWLINETTVTKITAAVITSGTTAEFTLDRKHDYEVGDVAVVSGMTPAGYNGTFTVTAVPSSTKFRANIGASPGAGTAFGETHENTHRVDIRSVRKHVWYRFRVQAENKDGCVGDWSGWTSWTLANDHNPPPSPLLVKGFTNSTNRLVVDWDPPLAYLPIEGTASVTSGTAAVVGVGTSFQTQVGRGDTIKLDAETFNVLSITDDTHLTLATNAVTTHTAAIPYQEEPDPDVAFYQVWVGTSTTVLNSSLYKRDRYCHVTKKSFRVADADAGTVFYLYVRSVDASGNRSAWIPATAAGNSSSGATPDGFAIGAGGGGFIVATFSKAGKLRAKHYSNKRWTNATDQTLYLKRARLTVGDKESSTGAPTGSAVKMNLRRWLADESAHAPVFDTGAGADRDDRLTVAAGTYKDTTNPNDFDITSLLNGQELSVKVTQVGSGFPGEDFTLAGLHELEPVGRQLWRCR